MYKVILPLQSYLRSTTVRRFPSNLSSTVSQVKTKSLPTASNSTIKPYHRSCSSSVARMSDLNVELTAPNSKKYNQPTGLFINNEWMKSSTGQKITSINPSYATQNEYGMNRLTVWPEMNRKSHQYMLHL